MSSPKNNRDSRVEALTERVRDSARTISNLRRFWVPASFAVIMILMGVAVAVMSNPPTNPELPLLDENVGEVAAFDIRAPISFTIPDTDATEHKRREAEAEIRSVYDFETELGNQRIRQLKEAFVSMSEVIAQFRERIEALENPPEEQQVLPEESKTNRSHKRSKAHRRNGRKREKIKQQLEQQQELANLRQELSDRLDQQKGEFLKLLQIVVKDGDFQELKADGFSQQTLKSISLLIERNMRHMIVPSQELLTADRSKGITVRFLRDGVPDRELDVLNFSRILDAEEALVRVGQTAALELSAMPIPLRNTQIRLAKALIAPNMSFNSSETKSRQREARDNVQPLEIPVQKGAIIVRDGDVINKHHILVCREIAKRTEVSNSFQIFLGTVFLVVISLFFVASFSARNIRKFRTSAKDLAMLATVMSVSLVSVKLWFWIFGAVEAQFGLFPLHSYYFAIPFATGAMLVRFVLNSEMALAFVAAFSAFAGMLMDSSIVFAVYCLVSSLVAASAVGTVRQRTSLLRAGAITGFANILLAIGMALFAGEFGLQTIISALFAFSGGILAAVIVTGVAPVIEVAFGYTTDIKLLELANLNHPLLKDLIVQAPGSYHHSIIVGSLVEAAAETIHCNPLLARVMAYYHDIGKIKKPAYFSENQRDGINRHDKLKPSLSASVLRAHVKDGAELARDSRLGQPIVAAILQHHGTSLMKFFYQRAKEHAENEDAIKDEDFRYAGPKPQMREVALVMLADSVEAAAKSISDPSPARLQGLVQNIINRIFVDGQLDECDLTLKDLHLIARAFNRVLTGIYHHRPDYPEAATKEREPVERKAKHDSKEITIKRDGDTKRQETPDEKQEDIKRLGI